MKRRIGGLLLVFFLAACEAQTVDTSAAPPPTALPTAVLEGVPTGTPEIVDTPTLTPTLTPSSTASPSPTPTAACSPSETATPNPSATPQILPTDTQAAAGGQCNNVLYPLSEGNRWLYRVTREDGNATISASVTAVEGNQASITLADPSGGFNSSLAVQCADSGLSGFSPAEIGFLFFSSDSSLEIRTVSGRLAPSEQEFAAQDWQYSWTTGLVASGRIAFGDPSAGGIELVFQEAPVTIDWQTAAAGVESVTVPAGTFPGARKVTARARFDLMIQTQFGGQDQLLPAVLNLTSLLWYQPHVGLLKQMFVSSEVRSGGCSYPLGIASKMELQEFSVSE
jgi:hypothetical protein